MQRKGTCQEFLPAASSGIIQWFDWSVLWCLIGSQEHMTKTHWTWGCFPACACRLFTRRRAWVNIRPSQLLSHVPRSVRSLRWLSLLLSVDVATISSNFVWKIIPICYALLECYYTNKSLKSCKFLAKSFLYTIEVKDKSKLCICWFLEEMAGKRERMVLIHNSPTVSYRWTHTWMASPLQMH